MQAFTLWLQYLTLLGSVNMPTPGSVRWLYSAASAAFATVTSNSLSIDCLLSDRVNTALARTLFHLAVPIIVLILLMLCTTIRSALGLNNALTIR